MVLCDKLIYARDKRIRSIYLATVLSAHLGGGDSGKLQLKLTWILGYKTYFMLNSAEHEILNAHKYKSIKKFSFFQTEISREC